MKLLKIIVMIMLLLGVFSTPLLAENDKARGIHVRDSDGQYLGILVDAGQFVLGTEYAAIFIPKIKMLVEINIQNTGKVRAYDWIWFDDYGCFGNAYMSGSIPRHNNIYRTGDGESARYFNIKGPIETTSVIVYSYLPPDTGECRNFQVPLFLSFKREAVEIDVNEIPFYLPVSLPVSYDTK